MKVVKYRSMAAIPGRSCGDLKQRDREWRMRLMLTIGSLAAVVLLGFGIFMFNACQRENIARIKAIQSNSSMLLNRITN